VHGLGFTRVEHCDAALGFHLGLLPNLGKIFQPAAGHVSEQPNIIKAWSDSKEVESCKLHESQMECAPIGEH